MTMLLSIAEAAIAFHWPAFGTGVKQNVMVQKAPQGAENQRSLQKHKGVGNSSELKTPRPKHTDDQAELASSVARHWIRQSGAVPVSDIAGSARIAVA